MNEQTAAQPYDSGQRRTFASRFATVPAIRSVARSFTLALLVVANLCAATAVAQQSQSGQGPAQPAAVERADDLKSKVTFSTYFTSNDRNYDINLRHQFGH